MSVVTLLLVATWPPLILAAVPLALVGFGSLRGRLALTTTLVGLAGLFFSALASLLPD